MSAEIINFTTHHRTPGADDAPRKTAGTLTATAKNERLRSARREAWWKADAHHELLEHAAGLHGRRVAREDLRLKGSLRTC